MCKNNQSLKTQGTYKTDFSGVKISSKQKINKERREQGKEKENKQINSLHYAEGLYWTLRCCLHCEYTDHGTYELICYICQNRITSLLYCHRGIAEQGLALQLIECTLVRIFWINVYHGGLCLCKLTKLHYLEYFRVASLFGITEQNVKCLLKCYFQPKENLLFHNRDYYCICSHLQKDITALFILMIILIW